MFESLSERLERSFKILKGEGKITEINVAETVKDIRKALLDADVSYKVAKDFCNRVKDKAIGANVLTAVKPQQVMVKIMHDELADFMGSEAQDINVKGNPGIVLVAGLNGSGKTTFSGKLALHIKSKKGMKVLLAACDTFRPAAIEQLKVLGEGIQVPVYTEEGEKDPIKIAKAAIDAGEEFNIVYAENDGMADGVVQALDAAGITHGVDGDVIVMGFDCNKWALEKLLAGEWNYDGQCSPFQAGVIDQMIKTLEAGGSIEGLNELNQIISVEKGFDARTITQDDIDTYGLG